MPILKIKKEGVWTEVFGGNSADSSVDIDSTLSQSGQAADAKAVGDKFTELTEMIQSNTAVSVEPEEDDIPKFFYGGDLPQTKTDTIMPFRYISKTQDISGYCETKAQGTSSMSYAKKNQTTKFYKDAACTEKMKVDFKGWGEQRKFCFKANWIDISHARNIVSARLWGDVVKSRSNYADLPELLRTSPNQGAIDGFPVKVYANGVYQGRYTLNIPKDGWMANMNDELETHCILCGENYVSGCFRAAANINESDWSDELHDTVPDSIKTRWNEVISFVMNSTDEEFKTNIGNYFDIPSLIDYHLFGLASCGLDAYGKNQIYMTYDGQKWIASMYDMDSTWGLYWNGSKFVATDYARESYEDMTSGRQGNLLYIRLEENFYEELQARWAELKNGALSISNIINRFERFTDIASTELVKEDYASTTGGGKFTGIPSQTTNNIQQIRAYALARQVWTDEYVAALTPEVPVPCTGITLSSETLTFTESGTQTLTATVTPDGCTDTITWESDNTSIATVSDGVVTAVANGSATITATCGEYSASCSVSVSGIAEPVPCTGISLDQTELTFEGEGTQTLTATVTPEDTTDMLVWTSSNPSVASIVVEGNTCTVQSMYNGNSTITVTCGAYSASCNVTVSGIESYLYQNYSPAGEKFTSDVSIDWETQFIEADIDLSACTGTKENILNVGENIASWAGGSKNYHIYYTASSATLYIYAVTGTARPYGSCAMITLDTTNAVMRFDKNGVVLNNQRLSEADFADDAGVADGTGAAYPVLVEYLNTLSAVQVGSAEGSVRSNATYNYIKIDTLIECTGVSLDAETLTFDGEGSKTLVATNTPADTNDVIVWSSSDTSVATVENGVVTAVGNGSAAITYTCGSQSASCEVSVSGYEYPVLYTLPEATTFDGTNYIDTGVQLFAEDKPFTLLVDWEGPEVAQSSNTVIHCMNEVSPYSGLQIMYMSSGRFKLEMNQTKSITIQALADDGLSTALSMTLRAALVKDSKGMLTIYRRYNGEGDVFATSAQGTYAQLEQSLLLGCYQSSDGTKGRYVKGIMSDCKVYDGVLSNYDINAWMTASSTSE